LVVFSDSTKQFKFQLKYFITEMNINIISKQLPVMIPFDWSLLDTTVQKTFQFEKLCYRQLRTAYIVKLLLEAGYLDHK
jgi:hypothetical protein